MRAKMKILKENPVTKAYLRMVLKNAMKITAISFMLFAVQTSMSFAKDPTAAPMNNLLTIVANIVTGIGGIVFIFNVVNFATAIKSQDGASRDQSVLGMLGGIAMVVAPQIVKFIVT